jgi:hypothetical protein
MCGSIACSLTSSPASRLSRKHCRGQALGTGPEALFGALNHCACRTDLGPPDSSCRLDIDDDRCLQIDQVVVGVGKEGMPFVSAGPLCGRIRLGDELRYRLAGCAPGTSSRVSRHSRTDRRILAMASQSTSLDPAAERCLSLEDELFVCEPRNCHELRWRSSAAGFTLQKCYRERATALQAIGCATLRCPGSRRRPTSSEQNSPSGRTGFRLSSLGDASGDG